MTGSRTAGIPFQRGRSGSRPLTHAGSETLLEAAEESGEGGEHRKVAPSCPTSSSSSSRASPTSGVNRKLVEGMQERKVSRKAGEGYFWRGTPAPTMLLSCFVPQVKSLVFSEGLWLGLESHMGRSQLGQSVRGGPLLAADSGLCPSITSILLIRLCQGCVSSTVTGIRAVQIGGVVR